MNAMLLSPSKIDNLTAKKQFWNGCLEVKLPYITDNLRLIQEHIGPSKRIMAILKSEGYGTCNITLAHHLWSLGIDILGLAYLHEALALRHAGVKQQIFLINICPDEIPTALAYDFELGIGSLETLCLLEKEAQKQQKIARLHLHVDTGMSRFGASLKEANLIFETASQSSWLKIEGVMTHFAASSSVQEDAFTHRQVKSFEGFLSTLSPIPPFRHISNSSAILRFPQYSFNMVRLGLSLYGISTSLASYKLLPLKNALTLKAKIIHIRQCQAGDTISYNRKFEVKKNLRVGVVSLGYADGIHLSFQQAKVHIQGVPTNILGSICMDCFMVDLTPIPRASIGDEVLLFGEDEYGNCISPESFAQKGHTIAHELISGLGPRIYRKFL